VFVDNAEQPAFVVPVFGRVIGDVSLNPEQLFWGIPGPERWGEFSNETVAVRRVMVSATQADRPLELSNVASSIKELSVALVTVETGKTYQVVARLTEPPKASQQGSISFNTNSSSQPQVVLPVTINVLPR
jgi:hypothetical protein